MLGLLRVKPLPDGLRALEPVQVVEVARLFGQVLELGDRELRPAFSDHLAGVPDARVRRAVVHLGPAVVVRRHDDASIGKALAQVLTDRKQPARAEGHENRSARASRDAPSRDPALAELDAGLVLAEALLSDQAERAGHLRTGPMPLAAVFVNTLHVHDAGFRLAHRYEQNVFLRLPRLAPALSGPESRGGAPSRP